MKKYVYCVNLINGHKKRWLKNWKCRQVVMPKLNEGIVN